MAKNIYHKRNINFRLLACGVLATLIFVGCDNKKNIEDKGNDTNTHINKQIELEPVAPNIQQVCSTTLANSIENTLRNSIKQKSASYATSQTQNAKINLNLKKIKELVNSISINVTQVSPNNISVDTGLVSCQASVNVSIPKNDIARADQMYANAKEQSFKQRLHAANIMLNENKITDDHFNFVVNPNSAIPQINITQESKLISLVSSTIANSVVKEQIDISIAARKAAISKKQAEKRAVREAKLKEQREQARKAAAQEAAQRLAQRNNIRRQTEEDPQPTAFQPLPTNSRKLSLESDGLPLNAKPKVIEKEQPLEKPFMANKPIETKDPKQNAPEANKSKFDVQGSDDIDIVIIEEQGTY